MDRSELTIDDVPLAPEDLQALYEEARGDTPQLLKLIHIEHLRKMNEADRDEEVEDFLGRLGLIGDVTTQQPRGISAGVLAAIELAGVNLERIGESKKGGKSSQFSDLCIVCFLSQADPQEWVGLLDDAETLKRAAIVYGTTVPLASMNDIFQALFDQVGSIDAITDDAKKKGKAKSRG